MWQSPRKTVFLNIKKFKLLQIPKPAAGAKIFWWFLPHLGHLSSPGRLAVVFSPFYSSFLRVMRRPPFFNSAGGRCFTGCLL